MERFAAEPYSGFDTGRNLCLLSESLGLAQALNVYLVKGLSLLSEVKLARMSSSNEK